MLVPSTTWARFRPDGIRCPYCSNHAKDDGNENGCNGYRKSSDIQPWKRGYKERKHSQRGDPHALPFCYGQGCAMANLPRFFGSEQR